MGDVLVSSQSECNAKVVPSALVKMHFEAYIDESSSAGTPGEKFESTKDRNKMFELMMDKNTQKGWEGVFMDLCIGTKGSIVLVRTCTDILTATSNHLHLDPEIQLAQCGAWRPKRPAWRSSPVRFRAGGGRCRAEYVCRHGQKQ